MDYKFTAGMPVDVTARLVVSGVEHFIPDRTSINQTWDIMPDLPDRPMSIKDLTGTRRGRMVLVGWFRTHTNYKGKSKYQIWMARCDCGTFETRRGPKFMKNTDKENCCEECKYKDQLKMKAKDRAIKNLTGKWPVSGKKKMSAA